MEKFNKNAVVNTLFAMRAQIDALLFMLEEDADECSHPKDRRIDYTTMGGKEHWHCKACNFEYKEE